MGWVHLATGLCHFEQVETPGARLELERALWHDDSLEDAFTPLADACLRMGDAQEAERFKVLLRLHCVFQISTVSTCVRDQAEAAPLGRKTLRRTLDKPGQCFSTKKGSPG
jgi:hypothetical protein